MEIIKAIMLFLVFITSTLIGKFLSKKYVYRLEELEEMQNALNIFKSKIKFTYEPLADIFDEISKNASKNIGDIFIKTKNEMNKLTASEAWEKTLDKIFKDNKTNLSKEDINILKNLSKLLGQTDAEGQVSQIEITQNFLNKQLKEAEEEKAKNEKLYSRLGTTIGLVIVIILL